MNIRECRIASGLRQRDLADKLGVDRITVVRWESGDANPKVDMIPAVADALGVSIEELFHKKDELLRKAE